MFPAVFEPGAPGSKRLQIHERKAIPIQSWTGPWSSSKLRLPEVIDNWYKKWQGCQPYAPAAFTPTGDSPEIHHCYRLNQWKIPMTTSGIEQATSRRSASTNYATAFSPPPSQPLSHFNFQVSECIWNPNIKMRPPLSLEIRGASCPPTRRYAQQNNVDKSVTCLFFKQKYL